MANFFTVSTRASRWFTPSIVAWISRRISAERCSGPLIPCSSANVAAAAGSSVTSAVRYLRRSPMSTASDTSWLSLMPASMSLGGDVLASGGDDDVLLAAGDREESVGVE